MTRIDVYTRVNRKIVLEYNDDETETSFPESGYYTSWSTCWFDVDHSKNDGWGGDDVRIGKEQTMVRPFRTFGHIDYRHARIRSSI